MDKIDLGKIEKILKKEKQILFAYYFGSVVKRNKNQNDLDIAVMLKKEMHGLDKLEFINKLSGELESIVNLPLDIVILNSASIALKQQVVKYGRLIFQQKKGLAQKFVLKVITEYFDYLQLLSFFRSRAVRGKYGR